MPSSVLNQPSAKPSAKLGGGFGPLSDGLAVGTDGQNGFFQLTCRDAEVRTPLSYCLLVV